MKTISLCMIVRDEEDVMARCLACVRDIVDEIIVVDTGSTDRTKEIAAEMGARVLDFEWVDDFAAARNYAFAQATMDYILWLDADDVIDAENQEALQALKESLDGEIDTIMMRYHVAFDENGKPTYTFYRERLVRREAGFRWFGRVHEAIVTGGKSIRSEIAVRHEKLRAGEPGRNLRIYERMLAEGETMEPRHRYYYARELYANGRDAEAIVLLEEAIEDKKTWIENRIGACKDLAGCCLRTGDTEGALKALCRSFALGDPRAEICCDLGRILMRRGDYRSAIFWYKAAPECTPSEQGGGFAMPECRGYVPFIQLCVCYDKIGKHDLAEMYNEKAAALKPGDPSVKLNREYFKKRKGATE